MLLTKILSTSTALLYHSHTRPEEEFEDIWADSIIPVRKARKGSSKTSKQGEEIDDVEDTPEEREYYKIKVTARALEITAPEGGTRWWLLVNTYPGVKLERTHEDLILEEVSDLLGARTDARFPFTLTSSLHDTFSRIGEGIGAHWIPLKNGAAMVSQVESEMSLGGDQEEDPDGGHADKNNEEDPVRADEVTNEEETKGLDHNAADDQDVDPDESELDESVVLEDDCISEGDDAVEDRDLDNLMRA